MGMSEKGKSVLAYLAMHNRLKLIRSSSDEVFIECIDYGAPLKVIAETPKAILLRRRGYRGWVGLGATEYFNPKYLIFRKHDDDTVIFPPIDVEYDRKTQKEALREAIELFAQIHDPDWNPKQPEAESDEGAVGGEG